MTSEFQSRLKEVAKETGGNRALCEKSGVSERTFANWLSGSSEPKIIGLAEIAKSAGVTIDWLVTGEKPKSRISAYEGDGTGTIDLPIVEKQETPGQDPVECPLKVVGHMPFSTEYLIGQVGQRRLDLLCLYKVKGDSMAPTMDDCDMVLIDRAEQELRDGLVMFHFKGLIHLKRVINVMDGIEVVSDNKELYPPHCIDARDLSCLRVIGRVIWVAKALA